MPAPSSQPYQMFMLGLCVYVLAALAAQTFFALDPETVTILDTADTAICFLFLTDFIRSAATAPNRREYLLRWGWLDLLSSIPTVDWLRWGRAARTFRILRVLRGLRATRFLASFALEYRAKSAFWATVLLAILATIFGSIAVLHLESTPDANIKTGADALWWAFVTITTVGYGDLYPVTATGRFLATVLMIIGIGVFGTFTAYVASWFVDAGEAEQDRLLEEIQADVRALREQLAAARIAPTPRRDAP